MADLPMTSDELVILLEALKEYELRLPARQQPARATLVAALIFRLAAELFSRQGLTADP